MQYELIPDVLDVRADVFCRLSRSLHLLLQLLNVGIVLRQGGANGILHVHACTRTYTQHDTRPHFSYLEVINGDKVRKERKHIFNLEQTAFLEQTHGPTRQSHDVGVVSVRLHLLSYILILLDDVFGNLQPQAFLRVLAPLLRVGHLPCQIHIIHLRTHKLLTQHLRIATPPTLRARSTASS